MYLSNLRSQLSLVILLFIPSLIYADNNQKVRTRNLSTHLITAGKVIPGETTVYIDESPQQTGTQATVLHSFPGLGQLSVPNPPVTATTFSVHPAELSPQTGLVSPASSPSEEYPNLLQILLSGGLPMPGTQVTAPVIPFLPTALTVMSTNAHHLPVSHSVPNTHHIVPLAQHTVVVQLQDQAGNTFFVSTHEPEEGAATILVSFSFQEQAFLVEMVDITPEIQDEITDTETTTANTETTTPGNAAATIAGAAAAVSPPTNPIDEIVAWVLFLYVITQQSLEV